MSVQRVTITGADEKFAPPSKEIDITVIDGKVFITVYGGSSDDLQAGRTHDYAVPALDLHDLVAALAVFGVSVQGLLISSRSA